MAVFLSARLMARHADDYDPDLAGAFQKLATGLPEVLEAHVRGTLDLMSRRRPEGSRRADGDPTPDQGVGRAAGRRHPLPGRDLRPDQGHPPGAGPAVSHRAIARHPGPLPHRLGRDPGRDADVQGRPDRGGRAGRRALRGAARRVGRGGPGPGLGHHRRPARPSTSSCASRRRSRPGSRETRWHPSERVGVAEDGSLGWRARVSGTLEIRSWILGWGADVEVLAPAELRAEIAGIVHQAAAIYAKAVRPGTI